MKTRKSLLLLLLSSFLLTGCFNNGVAPVNPPSEDPTTDPDDPGTDDPGTDEPGGDTPEPGTDDPTGDEDEPETQSEIDSIQDVNILHAWNWRLNNIKSRLKAIKKAGYGAIQISPMQPKVDKNQYMYSTIASQWWKYYQPLEFKVAGENESLLGTKSDLMALCTEAKKYDIKIVADVVLNHLAGKDNDYSSQVYNRYPLHTYGQKCNDDSIQAVVQGHIGLPDIDTSNKDTQVAVLNMMKEYIDCGVSGFRFDAAKHIETPEDGDYASDYWPTILNGTTTYATNKGLDTPYYYGEIINTAGKGRSFEQYTKYMSIVDSHQGTDTTEAVDDGFENRIGTSYHTGVNPDRLVLWAESHDTYANDDGYDLTREYSIDVINKSYMIQASRKDAATLYFARPIDMSYSICSISDSSGWKNIEVAAINKFHKRYIDKDEKITKESGCFINVRGKGSYAGVAIINIDQSESKELVIDGIEDGKYIDLISKDEYVISKGKVNAKFTNNGCILIPIDGYEEEEEDVSYDSNVVITNSNTTCSYFAWVWRNGSDGHWVQFNTDKDAIGININDGESYTIVEFPNGVTIRDVDWNKKIKQSIDMSYSGSQVIIDYKDITWK